MNVFVCVLNTAILRALFFIIILCEYFCCFFFIYILFLFGTLGMRESLMRAPALVCTYDCVSMCVCVCVRVVCVCIDCCQWLSLQ